MQIVPSCSFFFSGDKGYLCRSTRPGKEGGEGGGRVFVSSLGIEVKQQQQASFGTI